MRHALLACLVFLVMLPLCRGAEATWKKHVLQPPERTTGNINTAVAHDWNLDGHKDIIASFNGAVIMLPGPDWKSQIVLHKFIDPKTSKVAKRGCIHSTLMDVDGDGDLDFCGSNQEVFWLECPRRPLAEPWRYRTVDNQIKGTHCLITGDVDGNGRLNLIANSGRGPDQTPFPESLTWQQVRGRPGDSLQWHRHVFAERDAPGGSHYTGFGDVNGDGRPDISCAAKGGERFPGGEWFAWWEQPLDPHKPWKKHLLADHQVGATNILPVDLNGDGHLDFAATRGHGKGVLWFRAPDFTLIEIDPDIEGPHSLAASDMDLDGDIDLVTCGHQETGVATWYENNGKGFFTRHLVGRDQGSYDIRTVDLDADGDLDILVAGHFSNNLVWYENPLESRPRVNSYLVQPDYLERSHTFTAGTLPPCFAQQHFTRWQVRQGILTGVPAPRDQWQGGHGKTPALQVNHDYQDAIIQTRFRLDTARSIKLVVNARDPTHGKYHLGRVIVNPEQIQILKDPKPGSMASTKTTLAKRPIALTTNTWHTLTAEFLGSQILIHIDGKYFTYAQHEELAVQKHSFKFGMAGTRAQLDDIRVYRAIRNPAWPQAKAKLLKP